MTKEFNLSMEVGHLFSKKYQMNEAVEDWTGTEECSTMTKMTVDYALNTGASLENALDVMMEEIMKNGFEEVENHGYDDYCRGFLAGQILGQATEMNLRKVHAAEKLWETNIFGYYQDALEDVKTNH